MSFIEVYLHFFRPLNSHGFTVCHTISLPLSRSYGRLFVSQALTNFKWIFSKNHGFLRKQSKTAQSPVKKCRSMILDIQQKNK